MVKIKNRHEILNDVIRDGKKHPKGWKAVFGEDKKRLSRDYYVFNPNVGIYLMKEYQKNPFETRGIGGKVARHVDENIENELSKFSNDFGIIQGDFKKILKNLEKGIDPKKMFDSAVKGKKDYGISMPVRGHASSSDDIYKNISNELLHKQKKIDNKFEEIADEDGLYRSYD